MATSSWRLEDLQQLEELGLAGQLESTRLQEEGVGNEHETPSTDSGLLPQAEQDLYTMSSVLSDLLMTEAAPLTLTQTSSQTIFMETILVAPTAHLIKRDSPEVTYINRGQWYEIHLNPRVQETMLKDRTHYRCVLSVSFSELRLRNNECELLDRWGQEHPCEQLLNIDRRGCEGVSHVKECESLNSLSFLWQPLQRAIISVKINCLSSEFAAKKHGGEKGILLQICMDTYCVGCEEPDRHMQRARCIIKVFKDKGGDRKQKQDQLKLEKLSPTERARYQPSQDATPFSLVPSGGQVLSSPLPPSPLPLQSSPSSHPQSSPVAQLGSNQSSDLGVLSSIEEARHWLACHHFSSYLSLFSSYNGADLLRLSRRDLLELCGPADGIRLFNALRSRTLRRVYVCLEDKTVYQALSLEQLTGNEFLCKLSEKVGLKPCQVSCVLQLTNSGLLVMVDDTVVQNICDEDSFIVSAVKDENGTYRLLLRCQPAHTTPSPLDQS